MFANKYINYKNFYLYSSSYSSQPIMDLGLLACCDSQ